MIRHRSIGHDDLTSERGAIGYCDNNWGIVSIDEQAFMATVTVYQDVAAGSTTFLADNLTGFDDGQLPTAGGGGHWTIQNDFGYAFSNGDLVTVILGKTGGDYHAIGPGRTSCIGKLQSYLARAAAWASQFGVAAAVRNRPPARALRPTTG